jgi:hypothetical protein
MLELMEVRDWNREKEVIRASLLCCSIEADLVSTDLRGLTSHLCTPQWGHVCLATPCNSLVATLEASAPPP